MDRRYAALAKNIAKISANRIVRGVLPINVIPLIPWEKITGVPAFAPDPHGNEAHTENYITEVSIHGNEKHDPDFLSEIPVHGNEKHSENYLSTDSLAEALVKNRGWYIQPVPTYYLKPVEETGVNTNQDTSWFYTSISPGEFQGSYLISKGMTAAITAGKKQYDRAGLFCLTQPIVTPTWDLNFTFKVCLQMYSVSTVAGFLGRGRWRMVEGDYGPFVGFKVVNDTLWGQVGNGSSYSAVDLQTTLVAGSNYVLRCDYYAGNRVDFYVAGVLKGTITTTLPTGVIYAGYFPMLFVRSDDTGGAIRAMYCNEARLAQLIIAG